MFLERLRIFISSIRKEEGQMRDRLKQMKNRKEGRKEVKWESLWASQWVSELQSERKGEREWAVGFLTRTQSGGRRLNKHLWERENFRERRERKPGGTAAAHDSNLSELLLYLRLLIYFKSGSFWTLCQSWAGPRFSLFKTWLALISFSATGVWHFLDTQSTPDCVDLSPDWTGVCIRLFPDSFPPLSTPKYSHLETQPAPKSCWTLLVLGKVQVVCGALWGAVWWGRAPSACCYTALSLNTLWSSAKTTTTTWENRWR